MTTLEHCWTSPRAVARASHVVGRASSTVVRTTPALALAALISAGMVPGRASGEVLLPVAPSDTVSTAAASVTSHDGADAPWGVSLPSDAPELSELLSPPASGLAMLVHRFTVDRSALHRRYDLPSAERRARLAAFYASWAERMDEIPFEDLGVEERIDYLLLRNRIGYEQERLEVDELLHVEMEPLLPFDAPLVEIHEARRRLEPVDAPAAAETLDRVTAQIREVRAAVRSGLVDAGAPGAVTADPVVALRAVNRAEELRRTLDSWFGHFDGYDPAFGWWVREPHRAFVEELNGYIRFLREEVVGYVPGEEEPIIGDPMGREALVLDLEMEMIPYTPEELIEIGERELAWGEEQMRLAAQEMGFGDDWHAALEHVKTLHVEPGEQPELVRYLAREAEELMEAGDLVTVPPLAREIWRMTMLSPEVQRIAPFFFGGEVVQVAYPTDGMSHQEKVMSLRSNNRHFSRNAVQHELIPGHHLQGFMTERYNPHREAFRTPFWQEGWALYWELLLWEMDFPESPEDRIGMLFWRNHRAARIIFSLSFHLGEMTPQEAIDFLVERGGHELSSATGEVRRSFLGTYSPLYQAGYLLGGMQLRSLYRDVVESGEMTPREFHDHILKRGNMPIEMVRASVLGRELPRDFEPSWRFDDAFER